MPVFEYCVEKTISVAMKIEQWGYGLHGHDIRIEACFVSSVRVDIERLKSLLYDVLNRLDHRALWEVLGEDAMLEDILLYMCSQLNKGYHRYENVRLRRVVARVPSGSIALSCGDL